MVRIAGGKPPASGADSASDTSRPSARQTEITSTCCSGRRPGIRRALDDEPRLAVERHGAPSRPIPRRLMARSLRNALVVVRRIGHLNNRLSHGHLDESAQSPTTVIDEVIERVLPQQTGRKRVAGQQLVHLAVV